LEPEEVLRHAVLSAEAVTSMRFAAHVKGVLIGHDNETVLDGSADVTGVMLHRGSVSDTTIGFSLKTPKEKKPDMKGSIHFVRIGDDRYLRFDDFSQADEHPNILHRYFLLPSTPGAEASMPDGPFLSLQSKALDVVSNDGVTSIDGHRVYHYHVRIDPAILASLSRATSPTRAMSGSALSLEANGEVWIDASSFVLRRAKWDVRKLPLDDGTLAVAFNVDFTDHNKTLTVDPPEGATPLKPEMIPAMPSALWSLLWNETPSR
jgi:hypothetical protein